MAMNKSEKIWHDGKLIPWDEATVHVSAHALNYGSSVFEGIRAYERPNGAAIMTLEDHLDRMWGSCKVYRMEIPFSRDEIRQAIAENVTADEFRAAYADVFAGDERWQSLNAATSETYDWPESTYIKNPPYFDGMTLEVGEARDINGARCPAVLGDSITTA